MTQAIAASSRAQTKVGQITLPGGRRYIAVTEVLDLLSEQCAVYGFGSEYGIAPSDSAKSGECGGQDEPDRAGAGDDERAQRQRAFRLALERRAWTQFLRHAVFKSKILCARDSTGAPQTARKSITESFVATADLANWLLRRGFAVTFHPPLMSECGDTAVLNKQAIMRLPRKLRKSALIDEFRNRWPTVEIDLGKAATNGLSAARVDGNYGMYDVQAALHWAMENGRFTAADADRAARRSSGLAHALE